jgi:hypothetical protein
MVGSERKELSGHCRFSSCCRILHAKHRYQIHLRKDQATATRIATCHHLVAKIAATSLLRVA